MLTFDEPVLSIGHRGASAYAPENTLAAFQLAYEMGGDGVELDVQLSKDGHVVVIHDDRVERTTNGTGRVDELTLEELKTLDAGGWFAEEFAGEPMPTLDEVLNFAKGKVLLNIELKKIDKPKELVDSVIRLIAGRQMQNECLLTSFDERVMTLLADADLEIRFGLLIKKFHKKNLSGPWPFLALKWDGINSNIIKLVNGAGKKLVVWTVNEKEDIDAIRQMGVGRIITNFPDRVKNRQNS